MKVYDYIDHLVTGECSKLAIASVGAMTANPAISPTAVQVTNQNKFLNYINLANLAVHKKFLLIKKTVELDNPLEGEEYTLPSDFLVPIKAWYAADLDEVKIKDDTVRLISDVDTAVSILIDEPFKATIKGTDNEARTLIIMQYAASPAVVKTTYADLKISGVYTEAIINYAAYKAHSAIDGDIKAENNTYYLRYEAACKQIVNSGMWSNGEIIQNTKLTDNGFV